MSLADYMSINQMMTNMDYSYHLLTTSVALMEQRMNMNRQALLRKRRECEMLQQLIMRLEEEVDILACDLSEESKNQDEVGKAVG